MRTLNLAAAALGGLLTAAVMYGAAAAPAVNAASPAIGSQRAAVETVQYHHYGYPYHWNHHYWRHRYWRHHHWYYYN